jgi:drug/metabolite transporter (DMT)-like permease
MIHFVIISELVKVFIPYIRKSVLSLLEPFEFLLLNAFVIFLLSLFYLIYMIIFRNHSVSSTISKLSEFDHWHVGSMTLLGVATLFTTIIVLTMDKHYNTPLLNSMLFRTVSVVLLLITGVVIFEEMYTHKQVVGLIFALVGIGLIYQETEFAKNTDK